MRAPWPTRVYGCGCPKAALISTRERSGTAIRVDEAFGEQFLERMHCLIEGWHRARNGRVNCQVAAHAPDNCSRVILTALREAAAKHGLTRTCHLAQSLG